MSLRLQLQSFAVLMPIVWLILAVIVSAIAVIYSKHMSREQFIVLQKLEQQRDAMNEEWGRLLLEQSTWASPNRVEHDARTRLNMMIPTVAMTVMITP